MIQNMLHRVRLPVSRPRPAETRCHVLSGLMCISGQQQSGLWRHLLLLFFFFKSFILHHKPVQRCRGARNGQVVAFASCLF